MLDVGFFVFCILLYLLSFRSIEKSSQAGPCIGINAIYKGESPQGEISILKLGFVLPDSDKRFIDNGFHGTNLISETKKSGQR